MPGFSLYGKVGSISHGVETQNVGYTRDGGDDARLVYSASLETRRLTPMVWDTERVKYELVISQYVVDEAAAGDPVLAADRLRVLAGIPRLPGDIGDDPKTED